MAQQLGGLGRGRKGLAQELLSAFATAEEKYVSCVDGRWWWIGARDDAFCTT